MIHRSEFIRLLKQNLPEAIPFLQGNRLNLTLEMHAFQEFAQAAVESGNRGLVSRAFSFADQLWREGNRSVRSSLAVSFLEHLTFDSAAGVEAYKLLPEELKQVRREAIASLNQASTMRRS
ncbi:MAG: hypothetical protein U0X73_08390 [Thermoanaerobaculia bacterium]